MENNKELIKIRVDEWMAKMEITPDGTFIYVDVEDKEEVLGVMERELGDNKFSWPIKCGKPPSVIIDGVTYYTNEEGDGCERLK